MMCCQVSNFNSDAYGAENLIPANLKVALYWLFQSQQNM